MLLYKQLQIPHLNLSFISLKFKLPPLHLSDQPNFSDNQFLNSLATLTPEYQKLSKATMRWGRSKRNQEENNSTEKKGFSLSDLLSSFSWLSKLRSHNKPQSNLTSPKSPPCKPKCVSKNLVQNSKHYTPDPSSPRHVSTDQTVAPRRRSVGDEDRPIPNRHIRHYSVGGDHVRATSSMTLGHVIPFSVVLKQNQSIPPMSPLYRDEVRDPGLYPHKIRQRRRKLKGRLIVAASDDTHRRSFSGKTRSRRHHRVSTRSFRQGRKALENFAVVKRSSEPERDFKKSMVEMILEKGIRRPEELERLLACYLTLNADEHYDVIVKVFRQVCFEINRKQFGGKM